MHPTHSQLLRDSKPKSVLYTFFVAITEGGSELNLLIFSANKTGLKFDSTILLRINGVSYPLISLSSRLKGATTTKFHLAVLPLHKFVPAVHHRHKS